MSRHQIIQTVAELAAQQFGVSPAAVFAHDRTPAFVEARQWAYLQLSEGRVRGQSEPWSSVLIGQVLERDRSAISHGIRQARRRLAAAGTTDICQAGAAR